MGNTQSNSKEVSAAPTNTYTKTTNSHLGHIQHCEHPTYGLCIRKSQQFADSMMTQQKIRRLNTRMKKYSKNDWVLQVKGLQLYEKQEMCGHNNDLHLYIQCYKCKLQDMIDQKVKARKNCSQHQILQFLRRTVTALIYLQENGLRNCHVDKQSVVIVVGNIKVIDSGLVEQSPYQRLLDGKETNGFYVAPELLKDLKDRNYQPLVSPKCDVFSLGMLALELACLEPLDCYYDLTHKFCIDYESLIHRVSRIVYSVELKTLIAGMLEYQPDLRSGLITLQQKLHQLLHLNFEECPSTIKRSRSSSTKMLKQLLSQSNRSVSKCTNSSKTLHRKNSSTSLTSVASLNSRPSFKSATSFNNNDINNRVKKLAAPQPNDPSYLKHIVNAKTSNRSKLAIGQVRKITYPSKNTNKQNEFKITNADYATAHQSSSYVNNLKNLHDVKQYQMTSFGSRPFFSQSRPQHFTGTPKMPDFATLQEKQQKVPSASIFKEIQQNYQSYASEQADEKAGPAASRITGSNRQPLSNINQARQFTSQSYQIQTPISHSSNQMTYRRQSEQSRLESVSLRVKRSLENMYKTTKSINSSEEKEDSQIQLQQAKQTSHCIVFGNGCSYQGEVGDNNVIEGNGILYSPNHQIIYRGSWFEGLFEGFGELYNLNAESAEADLYDLDNNNNKWFKFEGEFSNGKRHGFGTLYFSRGQKFTGEMKADKANGCGCFYDKHNTMTSGRWIDNRYQVQ